MRTETCLYSSRDEDCSADASDQVCANQNTVKNSSSLTWYLRKKNSTTESSVFWWSKNWSQGIGCSRNEMAHSVAECWHWAIFQALTSDVLKFVLTRKVYISLHQPDLSKRNKCCWGWQKQGNRQMKHLISAFPGTLLRKHFTASIFAFGRRETAADSLTCEPRPLAAGCCCALNFNYTSLGTQKESHLLPSFLLRWFFFFAQFCLDQSCSPSKVLQMSSLDPKTPRYWISSHECSCPKTTLKLPITKTRCWDIFGGVTLGPTAEERVVKSGFSYLYSTPKQTQIVTKNGAARKVDVLKRDVAMQ